MEKSKVPIKLYSKRKRLIFKSILLLFPFFLLLVIEIILRVSSYGDNMHLFIKHPDTNYSNYYVINPNNGEKYFTKFDATSGSNDIFLKKKPANGYRIIVMGSSTVFGFPYDKNLTFSRILQSELQHAYPDKEVEVINTAITAINSITLNDYSREIVNYDPDLILFYAGHNEFYGAFGVGSHETLSQNEIVQRLHFKMMNFRVYQFVRTLYSEISEALHNGNDENAIKGTLMKRMVANNAIAYGSEDYIKGIDQYKKNVAQILTRFKKNDIPVLISDLVSNVRNLKPFTPVDESKSLKAQRLFKDATEAFLTSDTIKAKRLFYDAKDMDPIRFRASEEINSLIDSFVVEFGCYFVSAKASFEKETPAGIIGNELIIEHVHPTIEGQFVMANTFYDAIVSNKLIASDINEFTSVSQSYLQKHWKYSTLDSLIGEYKIKQLKSYWPFAPLGVEKTFRDIYEPVSLVDSLAFTVLQSTSPDVARLHGDLAAKYYNEGDYYAALTEYEAMIGINPYWSPFYDSAAKCYFEVNDLKSAEQSLRLSLKYVPDFYASFMLAEIEMTKHDFKSAFLHYSDALKLIENDEQLTLLKQKLYVASHFSGQIKEKEKIAQWFSKNDHTLNTQIPEIGFSYDQSVPLNIKEHITQAKLLIESNQFDEAGDILKQSIEINDSPIGNRLMGDLLLKQKNKDLLFYYEKAKPYYCYDPDFLKNYLLALYVNKHKEEAIQVLSQIKQIDPDYLGISQLENLINK